MELFNRNPNFAQNENFNPNLNPIENDLLNQNSQNIIKNQAVNFNNIQYNNNKQLVSPQNKFNSIGNIPNQTLEDINNTFNPQNSNFQQRQKFGYDNKSYNPQFLQNQNFHSQTILPTSENMFSNISNYYNNNQGNENFNIIKNNFQKLSNPNLQNFNASQVKGDGITSGLPNIVQPPIEPGFQQINPPNLTNLKEIHNIKPINPQIQGTFLYPGQRDSSQIRNNIQGFGGYSNSNSFGRDNNGNNKSFQSNMNLNNMQQNLNQNLQSNLTNNNNRNSNQKSPSNQNLIANNPIMNNLNLNNVNRQEFQAANIQSNAQNINNNQAQKVMNNKSQPKMVNLNNNPLSQLGNILGQNNQNFDQQQQQQFNLQNNSNNLNNFNNLNKLNNMNNQLPIANKIGGFSNINFSNDFKKKYTPLDNLRLQNPSLNLLNSSQLNSNLNFNKDNLLNPQNSNLKPKAVGVNYLFDMNLEESLKNTNLQNSQNQIMNKNSSDKKISGIENLSGANNQANNQNAFISAFEKSSENKLNTPISPSKDLMTSSFYTSITQSSENLGRISGLNADTKSNNENLNNFSNFGNLNNLANLNFNSNLNNMNNLNAMNNMNLPMQQQTVENLANQDNKKKKKPFVERVGDWVCIKCKNLNFSFRVVCNRCQLTKAESDKLFEQYMKNLMNYVKINEIIQNQVMNYPHLNTNFINQISNMDINSQQCLGDFLTKNNMSVDATGNLINNNTNLAQPGGFENNANNDLMYLNNNMNNLNLNNIENNEEKENAQQQLNLNLEKLNLNKNFFEGSDLENNKNINANNNNLISDQNVALNNNPNIKQNSLVENNVNNYANKEATNYPTLEILVSPNKNLIDTKQEIKIQDIPVINNQNQRTNDTNIQVPEKKNTNNISDFQTIKEQEKSDNKEINLEENKINQNTPINFSPAIKPISNNNNNYQSNEENYNSAYDNNYSYNKGNYYNSNYYNQNKNYRNDYNNPNNRNYRNPNKNLNYEKRNTQYYKNSGFSSDVHNK